MGDLTGQTVASTYSQLLNVASLDATYRNVTDGDGTASGLTLSTGGVRASLLNATGAVTFDSTLEVASAITATGGVAGNVTGDVTGDVTGNVTGNVTGSVTGNVTGDLTGNVTGNVTGSADTLTTGRTISATGDIAWTSAAFDGSGNVTGAATLSDDAVTTAKIADNQVTGAKIAMGSDAQGDILYYDGTDYVRLGAGTSGQVLQSGGAGANPSWVDQTAQNPSVPQVDFKDSGTSGTFTVPSGVTRVKVSAQGAGGTGFSSSWSSSSSYIGAGGAYFEKTFSVTAGDTISYSAAADTGMNSSSPRPSGASSTITYDSTTYTAGGGGGGYSTGQSVGGGTVTGTVDISVNGKGNRYGGHAGSGSLTKYGNGGYSDYNYSTAEGQGGYVKFEY